jgi:hypothetical protein
MDVSSTVIEGIQVRASGRATVGAEKAEDLFVE